MFGKELFTKGLEGLGITPEASPDLRVVFGYTIKTGRFKDSTIKVGLEIPTDFNVTCPTGPHITPCLIPMNSNGAGNDRAAGSSFGPDWQYLSRPFGDQQQGWNRTNRGVKAYLKHVKRILETL